MRILDYYPIVADREYGSMTHMLSLADALGGLGHQVLLVSYRPYRRVSGRFHFVSMPRRPFGSSRFGIGRPFRRAFVTVLLRFWRPDCVYYRFTLDTVASEVADRLGVPRVCECVVSVGWLAEAIADPFVKRSLLSADGVIAIKQATRDYLVSRLGLNPLTTLFLPDGFDPVVVNSGVRRQQVLPTSAFTVGGISGSSGYEDLETVVRGVSIAVRHIPAIRLSIAGDETVKCRVLSVARQVGLPSSAIQLWRQIPHYAIGEYLSRLDVGILAFRKFWFEKAGSGCDSTRFSEYLGAGLCVVATDLPGSQTYPLAQQGLFWAVPPEDPECLAEALVRLYQDPVVRTSMADAGQQYALSTRTWHHIASQVASLMERVVANRRHSV
jgi:glycosyltransferase involved in cell wall biosynthesis